MIEYLVRFHDSTTQNVRHTVVIATGDDDMQRLVRQRLRTPAWAGCRFVWAVVAADIPGPSSR